MKKRLTSLFMALLMVLSLFPTAVYAAGTISIDVGDVSVEPGGTAIVDVNIAGASDALLVGAYLDFNFPSALTLTEVVLSDSAKTAGFTFGTNTLSEGWVSIDGAASGSSMEDGVFLTLTFAVDANANGKYDIEVDYLDGDAGSVFDKDNNDVACTFTAGSVTVGSTAPYTANVSAPANEFTIGDNVAVSVNVGGTAGSFASAEVKLTYNATYLRLKGDTNTYATTHTLNGAEINVNDGVITLVDHGTAQNNGVAYVLNFEAIEATTGTTPVALTYAAFSVAEDAISENLTEATGLNTLNITVNKKQHTVSLPAGFEGDDTVVDGADYTFTADDTGIYYENYVVTATYENGGTATVTSNLNDGWTVAEVTDNLIINVERDAMQFDVTVTGEVDGVTCESKATYGTDFKFTVNQGREETSIEDGFYYVATATIGGNTVATQNGAANEAVIGTIAGLDITGNITINVTTEAILASQASFTITGEAAENLTAKDTSDNAVSGAVTKGTEVILVLDPLAGYDYTVTVNGGEPLTFTDNECNIGAINEATTVTVTKAVNKDTVAVYQYLTLNETNMWLVTVGTADLKTGLDADTNVYTYGGASMFYSTKYQAYCYLVVAADLPVDTAKEAVNIAAGSAVAIAYDMNVNLSKDGNGAAVVDANDAQLIYDMYQTKAYSDFTTVSMRKFLEADLNAVVSNGTLTNHGITVADAQVVVKACLDRLAAQG